MVILLSLLRIDDFKFFPSCPSMLSLFPYLCSITVFLLFFFFAGIGHER